MRDIITIAKRELKTIFTNKTMIASVIIVPFLLMFFCMSLGPMIAAENINAESFTTNGYVVNAPDIFIEAFDEVGLTVADVSEVNSIKEAIADGKIDLLVVFPENFILTTDPEELCNVEMWYNSSNMDSSYAQQFVMGILDSVRPVTFTLNIENPESYDLGPELDVFKEMMKIFIPTYSIYCIGLAGMTISAASIAGEKENGFMNLVLISPAKRRNIAFGKSASLFITNACTAIIVMLGILASTIVYKISEVEFNLNYSILDYFIMFAVSLSGAFVITSLLLIISAFAKTAKEANSRCTFILLAVMLIGLIAGLPAGTDIVNSISEYYQLIPVVNSILILGDVVNSDINLINILIASVINLAVSAVLTLFASKLFDNEKVMQL